MTSLTSTSSLVTIQNGYNLSKIQNKTTNITIEALEVSSLDQQGVYPSQECTALMYSHGCSSRKPKAEAAESARPDAVQWPIMSAPTGSIPRSSHPSGSQHADPALSGYRPAQSTHGLHHLGCHYLHLGVLSSRVIGFCRGGF
nr:hypothetical protein [Tanacetum cinerariifolium]GFA70648.1 hypothetical protein [Tanacetum cinerariifolium]